MFKHTYFARLCIMVICITTVLSLNCYATENMTDTPSEFLYFKFIDSNKNPVKDLKPHDFMSDSEFSDASGSIKLAYSEINFLNENEVLLDMYNVITGESKTFQTLTSADENSPIVLLWDLETPASSIANEQNKILFRAVDESGSPVENVKYSNFIEYLPTQSDEKNNGVKRKALDLQYQVLPTDENGETYWVYGEANDVLVTLTHNEKSKLYLLNIPASNFGKNLMYEFVI